MPTKYGTYGEVSSLPSEFVSSENVASGTSNPRNALSEQNFSSYPQIGDEQDSYQYPTSINGGHEISKIYPSQDLNDRKLSNIQQDSYDEKDADNEMQVLIQNESEKKSEENIRTASMANSIFNLSNAALGAGILGFPYAFKSGGMGAGLLISSIILLMASFTLHIITKICHKYNCSSYQVAVSMILGKKWKFLSEMVMMLYLIGALIIYLTVVGNCFQSPIQYYTVYFFHEDYFFTDRKFIISVLSIIFIFPLCLLKRISSLGFSSVLAFLAGIYLVGFAVITGIVKLATEGPAPNLNYAINLSLFADVFPQIFMAFPLIAFAFHCHVQLPPIYAELKNPSIVRGDIISVTTLIACNTLYMLVGIFGYLQHGQSTHDDFLLNYASSFLFANIGRLSIGINAIFSYPLNFFTVRLAIQTLFFGGVPLSTFWYYAFTVIMFILTLIGALFIPGISTAFGICGALGACSLMFVFPGLILFVDSKNNYKGSKFGKIFNMVLAIFFILFGVILALCGVTVTIVQIILPGK